MDDLSILGTAVAALLTAGVSYLGVMQKRSESQSDSTMELVNELQEELVRLREVNRDREDEYNRIYDEQHQMQLRLNRLSDTLHAWAAGIRRLVEQVKELGETPVWCPSSEEKDT